MSTICKGIRQALQRLKKPPFFHIFHLVDFLDVLITIIIDLSGKKQPTNLRSMMSQEIQDPDKGKCTISKI